MEAKIISTFNEYATSATVDRTHFEFFNNGNKTPDKIINYISSQTLNFLGKPKDKESIFIFNIIITNIITNVFKIAFDEYNSPSLEDIFNIADNSIIKQIDEIKNNINNILQ